MFREKENICNEVFKDIIHSKTDSFWQFIMDNSYKLWDSEMSRADFLNTLSDYEKLAVQFGNFNYQVENGGLIQWLENRYSDDFEDLYEFLRESDYIDKQEFLNILDYFLYVKAEIDNLDTYDDWYDKDYYSRIKTLEDFDSKYYEIQDSWKEYFEDYLIQNIPNEYVDKIYELDKNISY